VGAGSASNDHLRRRYDALLHDVATARPASLQD
jgi:hypothetical protein